MRIRWETWSGKVYEGDIVEIESDAIHVRLPNGTMVATDPRGIQIIT
jgi:hypothetical protein